MLKNLYIKNYALFEETAVDFSPGLNILTGETGAGKSLLVGALGLIMGKRADTSAVFFPGEKCIVEACFEVKDKQLLDKLGVSEEFDMDDRYILIRREINPAGKSRAFVNDSPASLQVVRQLSNRLFDLHGQHENHSLLQPDRQMELLDAFAENKLPLQNYQEHLLDCKRLRAQTLSLQTRLQQALEQQDYVRFQLDELEAARLEAGEEEKLEQEAHLLQHAEEIRDSLGLSIEALYNHETAIYQQLSETLERIEPFRDANEGISREAEKLQSARELIREAAFAFEAMLETAEANPERLSVIEERQALYHQLKLKYKVKSSEELLSLRDQLAGQIEGQDHLREALEAAEAHYETARQQLLKVALQIEKRREAAKTPLEKEVDRLLKEAGFKGAKLDIRLHRLLSDQGWLTHENQNLLPGSQGINRTEFYIQTNPGLPAGPLSQIASGGEVSRVMLAIKAALADKLDFPVLVFDEIDTGISGETAQRVGKIMEKLARHFQILSITHLPQIAAKGDSHFHIYKDIIKKRPVSTVRRLDHSERVYELARLMSGDQPSESAMQNAAELIG